MPPTGEQTLLDNSALVHSLPNDLLRASGEESQHPADNATCWHTIPTTPRLATSEAWVNDSSPSTPRKLSLREMTTQFEISALEDPFFDSDAALSTSTVSDPAGSLARNGGTDTSIESDAKEPAISWSLPEPVEKEDAPINVRNIPCSFQEYRCLLRIKVSLKRATRLVERRSLTMNDDEEEAATGDISPSPRGRETGQTSNTWPSTWGAWSNTWASTKPNTPSTTSSQSGGSSHLGSVTSSDDAQDRQKRRETDSDHIFDHGGFPHGSIWALDSTPEAREYFRTVSEGEKLPRHPFVIGTTSGGVAVGMTCSSHPPKSTASTTKKAAKKDRSCPCHPNIIVLHRKLVQGKTATGREVGTNIQGTLKGTPYLLPQRVVAVPLKFLVGQYKQRGKPAIVSDDFLAPLQRNGHFEKVMSDVKKWKYTAKADFLTNSIAARKAFRTGLAQN